MGINDRSGLLYEVNHFICTQNEFTFTLHKNRVLKSVPLQWNIESLFPSKYKIKDIDIHIKKKKNLTKYNKKGEHGCYF